MNSSIDRSGAIDLDRDAASVVDIEIHVAVEAWIGVAQSDEQEIGRAAADNLGVGRQVVGQVGRAVSDRAVDQHPALSGVDAAELLVLIEIVVGWAIGSAAREALIDFVQGKSGVHRSGGNGAADAQRVAKQAVANAKERQRDDHRHKDSAARH